MKQRMDMLNGSLWDKIMLFAFPVAATAILEQLFNASDIAIVGNFSYTNKTIAVAAVGANSFIISLIVNSFVGIALGANVVIANAIGRKDKDTVLKAVHTSILISLLAGIFVLLVGEIFSKSILGSMNVPGEVFNEALLYLRIYLLGMPVILLYNFEAAIFRSVGDTKTPLVVLTLSGIINVLLNLFFVIVLHMSVNGVAIATVCSNAISSICLFWRLICLEGMIHLDIKELKIDKEILVRILKIGLPAGMQSAVFSLANIVIQSSINSLGTIVMAASSAAFNIEIFAYDILNSFSQACTTFVGQNYGAGQIKRCKSVLVLCLIEDVMITALTTIIILFVGKNLISIFNNDPEVIQTGYTRLLVVFSAYIFSVLYENISGYLRGFGISFVPAILTTIGVCGVRIFWVLFMFPLQRVFQWLLMAYPVSLAFTAFLLFIALMVYRPSRKKENIYE